jgi:hypothetical protein
MRNFLKIAQNIDIIPLLHAVQRQPNLWNVNTLRTAHPGSPHSEIDDIWLCFNDLDTYLESGDTATIDEYDSIFYPAWNDLPQVRSIVFDLMRRVEGIRLGRVLITRLPAGKKIGTHTDSGPCATYYQRYHIILQNHPGSIFRGGDETICMNAGECWWFNNAAEHEVINNSVDDRLTLIVDIKC